MSEISDKIFNNVGVHIKLEDPDDFMVVRETLSRIGVSPKGKNILYQSCHLIHKNDIYIVAHFKELFSLDGLPSNISEEDIKRRNMIVKLLEDWELLEIIDKEKVKEEMRDPAVAYQLGQYLSEYEKQVIQDKVQVRTVVMNRLMQISQDEDNKVALKALELLGKASDLFTERSEITITHQSSAELKEALREKIRVLMQMNTIDATPKSVKLTNQLNDEITDV